MKRIVIFTAGFHARATFRHLRRRPDCRVVGFVDNNPAAQGTSLFDLPILNPRKLAALDFDVVAVPGRNQPAILAQLRDELRVEAGRIWQVNKSEVRPAADELERRGTDLAHLLRQTISVLERAGSDFWAMHSGLLGLVRGEELALFSDLDLCVTASGFEALEQWFQQAGLDPILVRDAGGFMDQISLRLKPAHAWDEPAMIDLHPITVGPSDALWPVNHKPLVLPSVFFHGHASRSYRAVPVRVPVRAEEVLAELYGPDWRRPAETWNGRYALRPLATTST